MPSQFSTSRANNFMCLSILLGNMLVFVIYFVAGFLQLVTGEEGNGIGGLLLSPGVSLVIGQVCVTLIPFLVYMAVTRQKFSDVIPLRPIGLLNIFLITLITLTIMPLASLVGAITTIFFENNIADIVGGIASMDIGMAILLIGIVPSVFEELVMRGVILSNYRHVDIRTAALVNGFFFGIFHMNPFQFFYAFLLGYLFSFFVFYTKSILSAIFAHFVFNTTQLLLLRWSLQFVGEASDAGIAVEEPSVLAQFVTLSIIAAIFTPVCIILFKTFKGINRKRIFRDELSMRRQARERLQQGQDEDIHIRDAARVSAEASLNTVLPQRIVTAGFICTIVVYVVFVIMVIL